MRIEEKKQNYKFFEGNFANFFVSMFFDFMIKVFEFLLFVFALFFVSPFLSAISLLILLFLYYFSYKNDFFEKEDIKPMEIISKYFSFPIILFLLMFISYDPSLKVAIIAFSAQGAMKALVKSI